MATNEMDFKFTCPVECLSKDGKGWKIRGIASTEDKDLQGEVVKQRGLDFSYIEEGKGLFNWNHKNDPQYILGKIDKAEVGEDKTVVEGYLFPEVDNAKALVGIMRSLKPGDKHRVQMSIEGKILRRGGQDNKTIDAAKIERVALTLDAVNQNTYAELVKSLVWKDPSHEFNTQENQKLGEEPVSTGEPAVKSSETSTETIPIAKQQIKDLAEKVKKMMTVGYGGADAPGTRTGGSAVSGESLEGDTKTTTWKPKKKKMGKAEDGDTDEEEKAFDEKERDLKKPDKKSFDGEDRRTLFKAIVLRFKKQYPNLELEKIMQMVYDYAESKV